MSRRLGYRGNVLAKWEGGQRYPTFGEVLRASARVGIDVGAALRRFHAPSAEAWDPAEPERVDGWLRALQGRTAQALVAERTGLSRQQVGRLLSGRTAGRLPMVMQVVDALTGRLPELVGELVPLEEVPELAREGQSRRALARLAFEHPWSPAAQAWLACRGEVDADGAATALGRDLGLPEELAAGLIEALVGAGVARIERGVLRKVAPPASVEVAATPEDMARLRAHWAGVSAGRMARGAVGDLFSFNVFAVGHDDLKRIQEAQRRFYREVRAIVSESPPQTVALLVVHTAPLVGG
ncbi:MAG: hypothetical protein H6738_05285 [Alphaproteobacteria bacterium]|nr:hypothetical protein [Alphaproteobacteria bacterium]MCB9696180.1 hypothetical protein [Alphaproteobacteria bacterium]